MPARRQPYRLLEHTGDIRARIAGRTLKHLFQNSVVTLIDLLVEGATVRRRSFRKIRVHAETTEILLIRLLQEVLFLFDAKRFVVRRLELLEWGGREIAARAWGEPFDADRHHPKTEIKGVTYHRLKIVKGRGGWTAKVVFDV